MRILLLCLASVLALGCGRAPQRPVTVPNAAPPSPSVPQAVGFNEAATPENPRAEIALDDPHGVATTTRNLYFVFDGSGSMADPLRHHTGKGPRSTKIVGAKAAVVEFVQALPADVNLGLFVFDAHGPREVVPLGPDNRKQFLAAIQAVHAKAGTPLGESIVAATEALARQYKRQLGYGEFRTIVVTDGISNGKISLADAANRAASYGFPIYTIGLDVAQNHELRNYSVKYYAADSFEELRRGLTDAAAESEVFDAQEFAK